MLRAWVDARGDVQSNSARELERALENIGREDIVYACMRNVQEVTSEDHVNEALKCIELGTVYYGNEWMNELINQLIN